MQSAFDKLTALMSAKVVRKALYRADTKYTVRELDIKDMDLNYIRELYHKFQLKQQGRETSREDAINWRENQLRLFAWLLIGYLAVRQINLDQMAQDDWQLISNAFPSKDILLLEYQAHNLLDSHDGAPRWTQDEDEAFSRLLKVHKPEDCPDRFKYKWSQLAKLLYIDSKRRYFRTAKQCRERWFNKLDPRKSRQEWSSLEDYCILKTYQVRGRKWAFVAKLLNNTRNQHSIKNRFKSLTTKESKMVKGSKAQDKLADHALKSLLSHANLDLGETMLMDERISFHNKAIEAEQKSILPAPIDLQEPTQQTRNVDMSPRLPIIPKVVRYDQPQMQTTMMHCWQFPQPMPYVWNFIPSFGFYH